MGTKAKEITKNEKMKLLVDKGYYSAKKIKESIDNNITPHIPTPQKE
ncbi:hypothetical protein MNB_SV-6-1384 [hydrothermal vent metagenome]|uniref:Uncharacterized protein n=1 Tax=hydrothermal vent metagenome TaxID=652676 RepID=A0A1W1BAB3_9ZZZZ